MNLCSTLSVVFLSSCAPKYVLPESKVGKVCIGKAKKVKNSCYKERQEEIDKCLVRREKQEAIFDKEEEELRQKEDYDPVEALAKGLTNALLLENCGNITQHCDAEYNRYFKTCGGSIE